MTMTQTISNGTARKSLAAEIDRLQETVAGLGQGLREAVRESASGAVREAVGELVAEVLTNPGLAALFQAAQAAPAQAPTPRSRGQGLLGRLAGWLRSPLQLARQAWQCACAYRGVLLGGLAGLAALAVGTAGPLLALAARLVGAAV
jgi:hypothetical protein